MEGKRDSLSHTTPFLVGWVERKNGILRLMSSRTGNILVCSHDSHVTCCCNYSKNYVWQYKIGLKKASSWSAKFRHQFNVAGKFINTLYFSSLHSTHKFFVAVFFSQAFVLMVICLTTSVVVIYYAFLLPVILEYSTPWSVFHLVTAHWLLINIVFHYFKAVLTSPGEVPKVT